MNRLKFLRILLYCFLVCLFSSFSCAEKNLGLEKEEKTFFACDASGSDEKLEWLKKYIDDIDTELEKEWGFIKYFEHKGKAYFEFGNCNPAVNYQAGYRNCKGESYDFTEVKTALGDLINGHPDAKWVWCGPKCDCKE